MNIFSLLIKLVLSILIIVIIIISSNLIFAEDIKLLDTNNNNKLDKIIINFDENIFGELNTNKLKLYSSANGLSTEKVESFSFVENYNINGSILELNISEFDLENFNNLNINSSTSSQLRLKSYVGIGIKYESGEEIKITYGNSFNKWKNIEIVENTDTEDNTDSNTENNTDTDSNTEDNSDTDADSNADSNDEDNSDTDTENDTDSNAEDNSDTSGESNTSNNESEQENTGENEEKDLETNSEAKIILQDKETKNKVIDLENKTITCNKIPCSINFNGDESIGNKFIWDFGDGEILEDKVNPSWHKYEEYGEYKVILKAGFKDKEIFNEDYFYVKIINSSFKDNEVKNEINNEIRELENENQEEIIDNSREIIENIPIVKYNFQQPSYILDKEHINDLYYCSPDKDSCKINLDLRGTFSEEFPAKNYLCKIITENKILDTCNPNTLEFNDINFSIKLIISLKNKSKSRVKILNFEYHKNNELKTKEKDLEAEDLEVEENKEKDLEAEDLEAKIILQDKETKNKVIDLENKTITCNKIPCSINFNGDESIGNKFIWDFGDGEILEDKVNPSWHKYEEYGEYKVILRAGFKDKEIFNEDYFYVKIINSSFKDNEVKDEIDNEIRELESFKIDKNIFENIKIIKASPNPEGSDKYEFIILKNNFNKDINLKGCYFDDNKEKGKPTLIKEDLIIKKNSELKVLKEIFKVGLNNKDDRIGLECDNKLIDELVWNFQVFDGYIVNKINTGKIEAYVVRVIDGDTIVVNISGKEYKVRLIGIDTPETKHPFKKIEYFGKEASKYTKDTLEGKNILLEFDWNPIDKYGRLLAYVWIKGDREKDIMFNKQILEDGYAFAYLRFKFKYESEFKKAENIAKKSKIGLWKEKDIIKEINKIKKEDKIFREEELKKEELKSIEILVNDINILKNKEELLENKILKDVNNINTKNNKNIVINSIKNKLGKNINNISYLNYGKNKILVSEYILNKTKVKVKYPKVGGINIYGESLKNKELIIIFSKSNFQKIKTDELGNFQIPINLSPGEYPLIILTKINDTPVILYKNNLKIKTYFPKEFLNSDKYSENKILKLDNYKNIEIILQGISIKTKNKTYNKQLETIICKTKKLCSINMKATKIKGIEYIWDFGNGDFSLKSNPLNIKYKPGNYSIIIKGYTKNGIEIFYKKIKVKILQIKKKKRVKKHKTKKIKKVKINLIQYDFYKYKDLNKNTLIRYGLLLSFILILFIIGVIKINNEAIQNKDTKKKINKNILTFK